MVGILFLLAAVTLSVHGQETLERLESRATELKARGDAAGALVAWRQAAALDTKSARIQDEIGFLLVVLNRRDEALQYFERAVHLEPQFAPAHYHLGVALWLEHKPSQSIPELQAAAALDRENFDYRFLLGNALNDTGNFREALSELSRCGRGLSARNYPEPVQSRCLQQSRSNVGSHWPRRRRRRTIREASQA